MNCIIFSRNRPCQLELLIRSIKEMWEDYPETYIIFKPDNVDYEKGYRLINESKFKLIREVIFKKDILQLIDKQKRYTMFLMDDDVFKETWALKSEYFSYFDKYDLLGISLRMHPRISYCYTKSVESKPFELNNNMWEWQKQKQDEWNYPMSLDGTVFLTFDILSLLQNLNYENPNTLEKTLAIHPINKKFMVCYERSKIINIPLNRVQNVFFNHSMKITPEYLNERFLKGERISLDNIRGLECNSPHQEVDIKWE